MKRFKSNMQTFKIPATRTCEIKQQRNNIRPIFEPINLKNYIRLIYFQANTGCIITFRSWNYPAPVLFLLWFFQLQFSYSHYFSVSATVFRFSVLFNYSYSYSSSDASLDMQHITSVCLTFFSWSFHQQSIVFAVRFQENQRGQAFAHPVSFSYLKHPLNICLWGRRWHNVQSEWGPKTEAQCCWQPQSTALLQLVWLE